MGGLSMALNVERFEASVKLALPRTVRTCCGGAAEGVTVGVDGPPPPQVARVTIMTPLAAARMNGLRFIEHPPALHAAPPLREEGILHTRRGRFNRRVSELGGNAGRDVGAPDVAARSPDVVLLVEVVG